MTCPAWFWCAVVRTPPIAGISWLPNWPGRNRNTGPRGRSARPRRQAADLTGVTIADGVESAVADIECADLGDARRARDGVATVISLKIVIDICQ